MNLTNAFTRSNSTTPSSLSMKRSIHKHGIDAVDSSTISTPSTDKRMKTMYVSPMNNDSIIRQSSTDNSKQLTVKLFNDLVHTHIKIEGICLEIVNTPEFQRLHRLKQLGTTDYVFRAAKHTRFEHSLGVAYLAEKVVKTLRRNQPELLITDNDLLCVKICGLCHDLGHGPYSHVYDGVFLKMMYPDGIDQFHSHWRHEDGSVQMFKHLLKCNNICLESYNLNADDLLFIEECISGTPEHERKGRPSNKFYLYDIVNNSSSGLDVDKLDYFQRDMMMTNVQMVSSASFDRFILNARVLPSVPLPDIKDTTSESQCNTISKWTPKVLALHDKSNFPYTICYPEKQVTEAVELFSARFKMHANVYTHKCVKQIEFMITDALKLANPYIKIRGSIRESNPDGLYLMSECIKDMTALSRLNDSIIDIIQYDPNPKLDPAREILTRIDKRQLYQCVGKSSYLRGDDIFKMSEQMILKELLMISNDDSFLNEGSTIDAIEPSIYTDNDYQSIDEEALPYIYTCSLSQESIYNQKINSKSNSYKRQPLDESDVIVEKMHIHYGLKEKNPVARMRFYSKNSATVGKEVNEQAYVAYLPRTFESHQVRIFCRSYNKNIQTTLADAFRYWCKVKRVHSPLPSFSQNEIASDDDNIYSQFDTIASSPR